MGGFCVSLFWLFCRGTHGRTDARAINSVRRRPFGHVAAGATWTRVTASAPWAARYSHATVIDAIAGAIFVVGGYGSSFTYYNDAWSSADGGADRAGGRGVTGRYSRGTHGVLTGYSWGALWRLAKVHWMGHRGATPRHQRPAGLSTGASGWSKGRGSLCVRYSSGYSGVLRGTKGGNIGMPRGPQGYSRGTLAGKRHAEES